MHPQDSDDASTTITHYIQRLKAEDSDAATRIWHAYFERLIPLARQRLRGLSDRAADEEDVLVSVFDRFFQAAKEGRFKKLDDRDDLWQILVMLVDRRIADQFRRVKATKRGGGNVRREGDLPNLDLAQIRELANQDPSPEYIVEFNDHVRRAIARLSEGKTREVAILRMEGYANQDIAQQLNISLSTVERKLRVIREVWEQEFEDTE